MPAGDPLAYLEPPVDAPVDVPMDIPVEGALPIEEPMLEETISVDTPDAMADAIIARTPGTAAELLSILAENGWELVQTGAPSPEIPVEENLGVGEEPTLPMSGSPMNLADMRRAAAASAIRGEGIV